MHAIVLVTLEPRKDREALWRLVVIGGYLHNPDWCTLCKPDQAARWSRSPNPEWKLLLEAENGTSICNVEEKRILETGYKNQTGRATKDNNKHCPSTPIITYYLPHYSNC
jgi:hypothetical protein